MPHGLACLMIATQGSAKSFAARHGGVDVDVVVVGHLLAVQLLGVRQPGPPVPVQRGPLVRVLAVAQHVAAVPARRRSRPASPSRRRGRARCPSRRRRRCRSAAVCANAAAASRCRSGSVKPPAWHRGEHVGVARRVDDDGDRRVVLRGGAHHRRAADVDLLDALVRRRAGGHRLPERVEVDHDQVERLDAQLVELRECSGLRRSASMPAWTAGCSVFTRPSRHSGKPVTCSTGVTGTPASAIRRAVAPVLTSSTPASASPRASSSMPALS